MECTGILLWLARDVEPLFLHRQEHCGAHVHGTVALPGELVLANLAMLGHLLVPTYPPGGMCITNYSKNSGTTWRASERWPVIHRNIHPGQFH